MPYLYRSLEFGIIDINQQFNMKNRQPVFNLPLFALGFRPFFALAGFSALALIALWRSVFDGTLVIDNYYPISYWHAHEMLLGYTSAVIAGFLLTAVQNWTGLPTVTGDKLAALCLLWIYGRILPFYSDFLYHGLIALVDFTFLPVLVYQISKPILKVKHKKSTMFIGFLLLLTFGNGLIHAELLGLKENTAWLGIRLAVATIILMILAISGRIFPFFTEKGLSTTLCIRNPLLDVLSLVSAALVFILELYDVSSAWLAISGIAAAVFNFLRVRNWYMQKVWHVPLLWILYIGYGWIIMGFILMSLSALSLVLSTLPLHSFAMGGIGVLTLGMMARVSLGHTGRTLKAAQGMTIGFVLINLAVFTRVLLPIAFGEWYSYLIYISTGAWLAAFSLFASIYAPILAQPRVDGKPG